MGMVKYCTELQEIVFVVFCFPLICLLGINRVHGNAFTCLKKWFRQGYLQ